MHKRQEAHTCGKWESLHVKEVGNPTMRGDQSTARRDRQSAQEGQASDRVGRQEGVLGGEGVHTRQVEH